MFKNQNDEATILSVAKQASTASLHGPTVWKLPIVGIEPATFRSESATLTTAPQDLWVNVSRPAWPCTFYDTVSWSTWDISPLDLYLFSTQVC